MTRAALVRAGSLALLATLGWEVATVSADIVKLKDGTRLDGDIKRTDDGWVVTTADGKKTLVAFEKVVGIEARPKTTADTVESRLASLRRASDGSGDLKQIIERYKQFVTQYDGTPAADKAKADLAIWQERQDRKMLKVGDRWLTAEEKAQAEAKAVETAKQFAEMLRQGRLREAGPQLEKATAETPQVAALWYLRGVLLYRQDQLPTARKAFETASAILPDHAPTLNNLAIILGRQNAHPAALVYYDRAMLAAPGNALILSNVAEALNALPEDQRNKEITKRVVRHFNEQDVILAAAMEKQGLFRWGSTFVSAKDMQNLQAAEKEIQGKLRDMGREFDALATRIAKIDSEIAYDERLARRMELDSQGVDAGTGRVVRYPLPAGYYDLQRDIATLRAERDQRTEQQERMRTTAKQLQQTLPTPRYTGLQRVIDIEGTPVPGGVEPMAPVPVAPPPGVAAPAGPVAPPAVPPVPQVEQPAPSIVPPPGVVPSPMPPATQPAAPPAPPPLPGFIPPEKPSILDRQP